MSKIAPYAKAVTGAIVAGLGSLAVALTPDEATGTVSVTAAEWVAVTIATLVASYAVYEIPNKDAAGEHADESVIDANEL